jgi:hypothetical protein
LQAPAFLCGATQAAFQAEYEGSIPFTRSKPFNDLSHLHRFILTKALLLILAKVRLMRLN